MTSRGFVNQNGTEYTEFESEAYQRDAALAAAERQKPKSCLKCIKFDVCTIFRNVHPMMESMFGMMQEKDQPFKAEQLAWLCKKYIPVVEKQQENGQ